MSCPHRLFVQARHVYSYCELGRLGWSGPWREMVRANVDFLLERGRRGDGFYVHRFDHKGEVFDARADLYDQAFMLLALAYAGRALRRPELFAAAEELGDALEKSWRLPHGGYFEGEIAACPPYRQNPHMHLLEGFIALHEASGSLRWRRDAEHIARLCARSFLHVESGALTEYFDAELSPLKGEDGRIVEPGHCFEWAWLFERLAQWDMAHATLISDGMARFARRHGLDPARGVAINEVMIDGSVRNPAARLWPQSERLKAALARLSAHRRGRGARRSRRSLCRPRPVFRDPRPRGLARQAFGRRLLDRGARAGQFDVPHHLRAGRADRDRGGLRPRARRQAADRSLGPNPRCMSLIRAPEPV